MGFDDIQEALCADVDSYASEDLLEELEQLELEAGETWVSSSYIYYVQ